MSTEQELDRLLDRPFVFQERPGPAGGDLRAVWRLPVLLMLVRACRGEKATPEQLHVLNWAVRSSESAESLAAFLDGKVRPEEAIVRFEPALDRAVALARGFELLAWNDRYWVLTERGRDLLHKVDGQAETLLMEKALLKQLPGPLTQAAVKKLLGRG